MARPFHSPHGLRPRSAAMEMITMHRTLLVGGLAALTLAAVGGVAFAQQAPDRAMRADTDGDSRLSQAEFVGHRMQRLTAVDTDRDGSVTADERRAAMHVRMAARADARFDRLDADDNGAVTRAEFDAARESGREARAEGGSRPMHARGRPGRGHDGMAGPNARAPVVIADARARAEQTFSRLDSDQDGFVTAAEHRTARQGMREQRRERMAARHAARQASPEAPASE